MSHSILMTLSIILLQKWVPLSAISAQGVSNRENMWLRRNWATALASLVRVSIALTHLET